jgi:hypothetical protein
MKQRARDGEPLLLATGEPVTARPDDGLQAVRQGRSASSAPRTRRY